MIVESPAEVGGEVCREVLEAARESGVDAWADVVSRPRRSPLDALQEVLSALAEARGNDVEKLLGGSDEVSLAPRDERVARFDRMARRVREEGRSRPFVLILDRVHLAPPEVIDAISALARCLREGDARGAVVVLRVDALDGSPRRNRAAAREDVGERSIEASRRRLARLAALEGVERIAVGLGSKSVGRTGGGDEDDRQGPSSNRPPRETSPRHSDRLLRVSSGRRGTSGVDPAASRASKTSLGTERLLAALSLLPSHPFDGALTTALEVETGGSRSEAIASGLAEAVELSRGRGLASRARPDAPGFAAEAVEAAAAALRRVLSRADGRFLVRARLEQRLSARNARTHASDEKRAVELLERAAVELSEAGMPSSAIEVREEIIGSATLSPNQRSDVRTRLAADHLRAGRPRHALARRALAERYRSAERPWWEVARGDRELAEIHVALGDARAARLHFERAVEIGSSATTSDLGDTAGAEQRIERLCALVGLAEVEAGQGYAARARALLDRASDLAACSLPTSEGTEERRLVCLRARIWLARSVCAATREARWDAITLAVRTALASRDGALGARAMEERIALAMRERSAQERRAAIEESVAFAIAIDSPRHEARFLTERGRNLATSGAPLEALSVLRVAVGVAERIDDPDTVAAANTEIGRLRRRAGDLAGARLLLENAIENTSRRPADAALAMAELAGILEAEGRYEEALEQARRGLRELRPSRHAERIAVCRLRVASIHAARGDFGAAEREGRAALDGFERAASAVGVSRVHGLLAEVKLRQGRIDEAWMHIAAADASADRAPGDETLRAAIDGLRARADAAATPDELFVVRPLEDAARRLDVAGSTCGRAACLLARAVRAVGRESDQVVAKALAEADEAGRASGDRRLRAEMALARAEIAAGGNREARASAADRLRAAYEEIEASACRDLTARYFIVRALVETDREKRRDALHRAEVEIEGLDAPVLQRRFAEVAALAADDRPPHDATARLETDHGTGATEPADASRSGATRRELEGVKGPRARNAHGSSEEREEAESFATRLAELHEDALRADGDEGLRALEMRGLRLFANALGAEGTSHVVVQGGVPRRRAAIGVPTVAEREPGRTAVERALSTGRVTSETSETGEWAVAAPILIEPNRRGALVATGRRGMRRRRSGAWAWSIARHFSAAWSSALRAIDATAQRERAEAETVAATATNLKLRGKIHRSTVQLALTRSELEERRRREDASTRIVGESHAMAEVLRLVARLSEVTLPILLVGESGTGKELVARALHAQSPRARSRFVVATGANPSDALIESELFGHRRGAFTGATEDREGLLVRASGGTLFLDGAESLSPALQVSLLRVLEEGELKPLGSEEAVRVDLRVVSSTSTDLRALVAAGRFREDLYFRLAGATIRVPALRERRGDVPALARHFLQTIATRESQEEKRLTVRAARTLMQRDWPGNVRELRNVIERAHVLAAGAEVDIEHLGDAPALPAGSPLEYRDARDEFDRQYFTVLLHKHEGNVAKAARECGLSRESLYRHLRKHGLRPS